MCVVSINSDVIVAIVTDVVGGAAYNINQVVIFIDVADDDWTFDSAIITHTFVFSAGGNHSIESVALGGELVDKLGVIRNKAGGELVIYKFSGTGVECGALRGELVEVVGIGDAAGVVSDVIDVSFTRDVEHGFLIMPYSCSILEFILAMN